MKFKQKNYVVVGASAGIGREITRQLLAEGASVWTISRHEPETLHENETWMASDATTEEFSLGELPEVLHGLIYCPGSINLKPFHRISASDFRKELEINTVGAFRAIQMALPALKKSAGSASVLLFSTVAAQTGMPFHAGIAAAKGANEGLTRALAAEFAPGIRVNCIAPSLTDTPLAAGLLNTAEKRQNAAARHPLRRIGSTSDMAAAALFLLSDEAGFITGQILQLDGGMGTLRGT